MIYSCMTLRPYRGRLVQLTMIESLCIAAATTVLLLALSMVSLLLPSAKRAASARAGEETSRSGPPQPAEDASRLLLELAVRLRSAEFKIDNVFETSSGPAASQLDRLIDAVPSDWVGGRSGMFRRQRLVDALSVAAADRRSGGWLLAVARWRCAAAWESEQGEVAAERAFRTVATQWGELIGSFAVPGELDARSVWFAVPLGELDVASEPCAAAWLRRLTGRLNGMCTGEADHPPESAAVLKAWRCTSADALASGLEEVDTRFEDADAQTAAAEWHWNDAWVPLEIHSDGPAAELAVTEPATPQTDSVAAPQVEPAAASAVEPAAARAAEPPAVPPAKPRATPPVEAAEPPAEWVRDRRVASWPGEDEPENAKKSLQDEISDMFAADGVANKSPADPEEQIAEDLREVAKTTAQGLQPSAAKPSAGPKPVPEDTSPLNSDDIAKLFAAAEAAKG